MSPIVETRGLTKLYGSTVGIEGLDLSVEPGEIVGLLGPNAAGKTTAIRLLLDLIRPTRGEVSIFGRKPGDPEIRSRIGYLPGEVVLDGRLTGRRTVGLFGSLHGDRRSGELSDRLGLPPEDLARRVRDYSRGMRQKLGLVVALQHDPELLLLDEPTSGLDPLVREEVLSLLIEARGEGKTVLFSSHVLGEADRICDRVAVLRAGRLVASMTVEEARRSTRRRMVVELENEARDEVFDLPGVEIIEGKGRRRILGVTGEIGPLLEELGRRGVRSMAFPEPSLEEAFVELYRGGNGERTGGGQG